MFLSFLYSLNVGEHFLAKQELSFVVSLIKMGHKAGIHYDLANELNFTSPTKQQFHTTCSKQLRHCLSVSHKLFLLNISSFLHKLFLLNISSFLSLLISVSHHLQ